MKAKYAIAAGIVATLVLAAVVGGLFIYRQRKMVHDSINKFMAAKTLYDDSQWAEAELLFSEVATNYPRTEVGPRSLYYSAIIMQANGRYAEALDKWQTLAQRGGLQRGDEIDYYMGQCLENLGEMSQASTKYARVAASHQAGEFAALAKTGLGRVSESEGNYEEARTLYEEAMSIAGDPATRELAERLLGELNLRMFLSKREDEYKKAYLIRPGDSMVSVALRHKTTVDLICTLSDVSDPARIRPNMRILIPETDFSIVIDKSDFKLTLYNHGEFFKSYKVGLGKHGATPAGEFVISEKIKNPTWWSRNGPVPPGDPNNELGTRWMALKPLTPGIGPDYGIHGTIDPSTVGWESSNGCPRMYPPEAEELFMLITEGTPVRIEP